MKPGKRLFDLFWALLGLALAWPIFALIALIIKLDDGGPVFFLQERIGYKGQPFRIWKFRTMVIDADERGTSLTVGRDHRITRVGHFLRRYKLDELPQLFNVVGGSMSFVGPRPEVARWVDLYTPEQRKVLDLVPGITDPASISYRNESDILGQSCDPERTYWQEIKPVKIRLSLEYGARATVWSDFLLMLQTVSGR